MAAQQCRYPPQSAGLRFDDDENADADDDINDSDEEDGDGEDSGYAEEEKEEEEEEDFVGFDKEYEIDETDSIPEANKKTINILEWKAKKISTTEIAKLFPHKQKPQIKDKLQRLRRKFQKQKDGQKDVKFKNSDEKKLYELSMEIWGEITTATTTNRTACNEKAGQEEKSNTSAAYDAKQDMVLINDDAVLKGFDEYLWSRSIQINDEKQPVKLEMQWRKLAYGKATHNLAIAEFAIELQQHKFHGYIKD
ncbi:uncharacterized protein LOC126804661 [Argentina anserina]|uniref:uncharacterized protein LOC126804661 n=1 Tax=Argentina anserina TaxID=57926 RepID=UPI0021766FFE|nr:uncharacterized protein LOC126804661 [Potentilla anserina]